jgi:hypothetical protein
MPAMLGLTGRDGDGWSLGGSRGRSRKLKHRVERRREMHEFRREASRWQFAADFDVDPLDDPSDCAHGCNGECEARGSEACTFLCHPVELQAQVEQWAEQTGHCDPAGVPDEALVRAHLDRWAALAAR